jgi:hypothetical protein
MSECLHGWVHSLDMYAQPVGCAEAAALGKLVCLRRLALKKCQLDDCCVTDILQKLA